MKVNIEYEIRVQFSGVNLTQVSENVERFAEESSCAFIHPGADVFHGPRGYHKLRDTRLQHFAHQVSNRFTKAIKRGK